MYKVAWVGQEEVEKVFEEEPGPVVWYSSVSVGLEWRERGGGRGKRFGQVCFEGRRETETQGGGGIMRKKGRRHGRKIPKGNEAGVRWRDRKTWSGKNVEEDRIAVWFISHLSHSLDIQGRGRKPVRQSLQRSWPLYGSEQWPPSRVPAPHSW